jgi:predicted O-methyltransferase YrrM
MTGLATRGRIRRESADGLRLARAVRELSARGDWVGRVVRRALVEAVARRPGRREQEYLRRIEALRHELTASDRVIERIDFGAGDGVPLSQASYHDGVAVVHTIGEFCRGSCMGPVWSRVLFYLVREAAPVHALELGTALGLSAGYQGAALELNGHGRLVTIEGAGPLADIARDNLARLGISSVEVVTGRFREALPPVLEGLQPLDFAYLDGHHDGRATLDYFGAVLSALRSPAIVVLDDISISPGMREAWQEISRHPRVTLALDLQKLGICGVGE